MLTIAIRKGQQPFRSWARDHCPDLLEDAAQDAQLALLKISSAGFTPQQCHECARTVASRKVQEAIRRLAKLMVIPKDAFSNRESGIYQEAADADDESTQWEMWVQLRPPDKDNNPIRTKLRNLTPAQIAVVDRALRSMSAREAQLVLRVLDGDSFAHAAEALCISPTSAQRYLSRLIRHMEHTNANKPPE